MMMRLIRLHVDGAHYNEAFIGLHVKGVHYNDAPHRAACRWCTL